MTALVTEHLVLQGIRSTLTAESASRAALYLAALTGSLIALGFVTADHAVLGPFAVAVFPALLILGEFTYWRLVQSGVEDLHHAWEMRRIRAYYRELVPPGLPFFADARAESFARPAKQFMGVRARDPNRLLTASSMVAAINGIVAGAGAALLVHAAAQVAAGPAIDLGALIAIVLFLVHGRPATPKNRQFHGFGASGGGLSSLTWANGPQGRRRWVARSRRMRDSAGSCSCCRYSAAASAKPSPRH